MADGTRTKFMEDQIKKCDLRIQEFAAEFQKQLDLISGKVDQEWTTKFQKFESNLDSKLEAHAASLEARMDAKFTALIQVLTKDKNPATGEVMLLDKAAAMGTPSARVKTMREEGSGVHHKGGKPFLTGFPRIELPLFSGENPKGGNVTDFLQFAKFLNSANWKPLNCT